MISKIKIVIAILNLAVFVFASILKIREMHRSATCKEIVQVKQGDG